VEAVQDPQMITTVALEQVVVVQEEQELS